MKLYHYSSKEDIKVLKVDYFNDNSYTNNDYKISKLERSFWYYDIDSIEYRFKGNKHVYTSEILEGDVYNLNDDKLQVRGEYKHNIDGLLQYIKQQGYKGILYDIGNLHIVNLFYDVNVLEIK